MARQTGSVVLIGFMGSGKSTVGGILADRMRLRLVDVDRMVVERAGMPIAEIFSSRGEEEFRRLESACLAELAGRPGLVVATGGGAPMEPENRGFFPRGRTFFLHVGYEEFRERTRRDARRPILREPEERLRGRFLERQRVYEELGIRVETDGRRPEDVASDILTILRGRLRPGSRREARRGPPPPRTPPSR